MTLAEALTVAAVTVNGDLSPAGAAEAGERLAAVVEWWSLAHVPEVRALGPRR